MPDSMRERVRDGVHVLEVDIEDIEERLSRELVVVIEKMETIRGFR